MTTVNAGLKEVYEGKIQNQLNEEQVAMKRLERSSDGVVDTVGGKYVTFPIRTQRNAGVSYRGENSQIAPPGRQGYSAVQVPLKYGYGRFAFTGQVMDLAETNYQAFANMADEEMDRLKSDLNKDQNRIAYGHKAGNAVLAQINDTATSATHAVVDTQYLEVGQVVDVLVVATGVATGGIQSTQAVPVTITNISGVNVTFSASFGAATTGHGVYRFGNRTLEPTGLCQIVAASGQLHGLDPATTPIWASSVIANAGTPIALTEVKMITACDTARRKGGKTSAIFTSLGVRRAYFNLLTQQRRYTETKSYPGGFQGLPFNYGTEIPIVEDPDAPPNRMWFLDESKIKIYRNKDWAFTTADGDILKWVRDYDLWEGMMKQYWEVGTSQRDAHVLYDDVLEA
jgi:hypothetical protein